MKSKGKVSVLLAIFLCITVLITVTPRAQAAGYFTENDVSNVECSILSNPVHAAYVNAMMRYHILSPDGNFRIGRNLENGASVVFFFDGCSDNVDHPVYGNFNNYHLSAYCAVVQKVGGVPKVVFESENCATVPDNPRDVTFNENQAVPTLLDGVYNIVSTNHKGRYAALNICDQSYSSAPVLRCDDATSYISTSAGINIHARRYFPGVPENGVSAETYNSTGCLNVGLIDNSWQEYNDFIYTVLGVSNAIITSPEENGEWTQCQPHQDNGVVVVDRALYRAQLADIYGGDNSHTAAALVSQITSYTDDLNKRWSAPFADVRFADWQYAAAEYACEKNLMAGKGTDACGRIIFDPNNSIKREEFAQVLYNAEDKPTVTINNPFPDVKNDWYKNAVLWANQAGIASGMGNGSFGVGLNISRQDLAMMLYKYAGMKGLDQTATPGMIDRFADGDKVSGYATEAMNWAVTKGILSGKGEAGKPLSTFRLDPAGTATRAECAAMLRNFMTAFEEALSACRHSAMINTQAKPVTCTEKGNIAYWYCADCDKYFADSTAATEITLADTVLEAPGHSLSFQKTVAATCGDQGYDLHGCANCDYTEKKNFVPAIEHSYTTMDLPTAAAKAVEADPLGPNAFNYAKYAVTDYCDYDTQICTVCNHIDLAATHFRYSQLEAAQMMLGWVNDLRAEVFGTHAYDLVLDDFCQRSAEFRAVQLITDYSHSGQITPGECITSHLSLYDQFVSLKNSPRHYEIMIRKDNQYFGYGYASNESEEWTATQGFGCMTFG